MSLLRVYGLFAKDRGLDQLASAITAQTSILFPDWERLHVVIAPQLNSFQGPRRLTIVIEGLLEAPKAQRDLLCPLVKCLKGLIKEWASKYLPDETVVVEIFTAVHRPTGDVHSSFIIPSARQSEAP